MFNVSFTQFPTHIKQKKEWITVAQDAYKIKIALAELKKQDKVFMDKLKHLSNNENAKGGGYIFSKQINNGKIQYKNIPFLQTIDLEEYRGQAFESWKLEKK